MPAETQLDKPLLRARLREARRKIPPDEARQAARRIADRAKPFLDAILAATGGVPARTPVALYAALPGELDCLPLLTKLGELGFPTLLPVAGAKATPLQFRLWRPGEKLVAGRYGLREPGASAPEMDAKIVFAPLLGFDGQGGRLGFGGGYYDATLAALRRKNLIAAGGLAFAFQKIDTIPLEPHDEKLDFVITEERVFDFTTDR